MNVLPSMEAHDFPAQPGEAPLQPYAQAFLAGHMQAHLSACRLVGEVPGNPIGRAAPRAWFLYLRNSSVRLRVAPIVPPPLIARLAHPGSPTSAGMACPAPRGVR